ncbi:hypothetical protein GCM10010168_49310 [Actinoplanes ianthinogenes]|uniref:Uncharacterized protein n=1 Tax=Actinoplanes ianthinogenes TaxID=122358 RepID=A0ABM7M355_9ACTN|nr:hypothetical protein [Actinoplanes ianthinogenes]BCJ45983.1 hypothetical protein Aiant_66400 [Actinoplanes ianthinogenes]GGR25510.1 hypothetical protein GCM10010168_49310 [Actinoplanes ianthinogenes]
MSLAGTRVDLATGDVFRAGGRVLLAGLGPLLAADPAGEDALLLHTRDGERWLLRVSASSGLVASLEPIASRATDEPLAPVAGDRVQVDAPV